MTGTLRRLDTLVRAGGANTPFCKLVGAVVGVFLLVWWLSRSK